MISRISTGEVGDLYMDDDLLKFTRTLDLCLLIHIYFRHDICEVIVKSLRYFFGIRYNKPIVVFISSISLAIYLIISFNYPLCRQAFWNLIILNIQQRFKSE